MNPSVTGPPASPTATTFRRDTADFGAVPGPGEEGPRRTRIGRFQAPLWRRRRIGLLLLAGVVLPWLPIFGSANDPTPAKRVRGIGHAQILGFEFSPDGALIATIQTDRRVALRDATWGSVGRSCLVHDGPAHALAFSPDGRWLALGSPGPDIILYDVRAGGAGHLLGIPIRETKGLAFSPDGRMLAASSYLDSEILLWDLGAGHEQARLQGHQSPVISLAFAPDGHSLASGSTNDPAIVVWDLSCSRPRCRLSVPPGSVRLTSLLSGRQLAGLGRNLRRSDPALGPTSRATGSAHWRPRTLKEPDGLLARRTTACDNRPG